MQQRMYDVLKRYWGYGSFRPLQKEAILSILEERESLTVLPTGGGKSLCFQLPALLKDGMACVISPLIALMKDQVDGLKDMGISAAYLNSSISLTEERAVIDSIRMGKIKLLYISPERLQKETMIRLLKSAGVSFFVIDEAHCISHWGHDFREDYRNLGIIKKTFAGIKIHAFTATATGEVREDIIEQLAFNDPAIQIGSVDRPNLIYRVMPRVTIIKQITDVLERHPNEAGIIYCLRRDDVENVSAKLNGLGFKNLPYHAGMADSARHLHQDRFVREEVDIIVATVAFGLGIDRSNIRFVIHAAMPKTIEHYHQETGRAGRDGLASYCYMFYGGMDYRTWKFFLENSPNRDAMMVKLGAIYNFCTRPECRHRIFANYFGQPYKRTSCEACDYCLNELEMIEDPLPLGRKILSCVAGVRERGGFGFGADHIANVLKGNALDRIIGRGHQNLSTFGIMPEASIPFIRYMIEQLIGQGFLLREGEFSTLLVTPSGRELLSGNATPILVKPMIAAKKKEIKKKAREKKEKDWAGMDQKLFRLLRKKRAELAGKQGVPAYIIFGDKSLKDMALIKPATREAFATVFGVGEHKLKIYAETFIRVISDYLP